MQPFWDSTANLFFFGLIQPLCRTMPSDVIHTTRFDSAANLVAMGLMKPPMNFLAIGLMQPLRRTTMRPIGLATNTGRPWLEVKMNWPTQNA